MSLASFYTPLKTSENHRFSHIFRGYRKRPVEWNGLKHSYYIDLLKISQPKFWIIQKIYWVTLTKRSSNYYLIYMRRFARFSTICTIYNSWKQPWRNVAINSKTVKNAHGGLFPFRKVAGRLKLKLTLLHGCFSRFLNFTNGTKLRKASHNCLRPNAFLLKAFLWFRVLVSLFMWCF